MKIIIFTVLVIIPHREAELQSPKAGLEAKTGHVLASNSLMIISLKS